MIVTVLSSDKLSMSMYIDYLMASLYKDREVSVLDLNCLYSKDVQAQLLKDKTQGNRDADLIVKYKIKKQTKYPEGVSLEVIEASDFVIQFDLFSTHPEVRKAVTPYLIEENLAQWDKHIEFMNKV